ncbi:hypothetical protein ACMGDK_09460 [Chryseobacterium sp. DT-3]|uniref:hypothetical protein n=1 Tax=Chryseobacterium sp. DT-3 TaxID=3396164 RepID=UPI003F1DBD8E
MQDNLRVYFKDKYFFESLVKKKGNFNVTLNSEDIKKDNSTASYYPIKGEIGSLVYVIHSHTAYIENSIHQYYNYLKAGKGFNYNDFSYCNLIQTLDELRNEFPDYDFSDTKVTNLEFGFNLRLDRNVKDIIEKNILMYKFKTHNMFEDKKGFVLKKFKSGNYTFKIYDKGRQNKLNYELLRIELKYNTKELEKFGILNFCDLYDPHKNIALFKDFIKKFDFLMIVDDRFTEGLADEDIANLGNKLEYTFWKRDFGSDATKGRSKVRLKNYIKAKKLDKTFIYLKNKIIQKFDELFKDCENSYPIAIGF